MKDYLVVFRIMDHIHVSWGPQWRNEYEIVRLEDPIEYREDMESIHTFLMAKNFAKRLEFVSVTILETDRPTAGLGPTLPVLSH